MADNGPPELPTSQSAETEPIASETARETEAPAVHSTETPDFYSTANGNAKANGSATANGNATTTLEQAKDVVVSTAQQAIASVQNNQTVQQLAEGPVARNLKEEASKTSTEFQNLTKARTVSATPAVTGQPLTQYHSMFYRLLSWENPRATAATFLGTIILILAARYLNVVKYALKGTYFVLGVASSIEILGKLLFDDGLASKMRPKKYWTIPRESLERGLDDVEQLINFFVIESQRVVWAENIGVTVAVFASALVSYWLIKLVPFWGLALIGTCVVYLSPLIYIKNRQVIDEGLEEVSNVISSQATQLKSITAEQTGKSTESLKSYTNELTQKAQDLIGSRTTANADAKKMSNLPSAPTHEPTAKSESVAGTPMETEPLLSH